MRSDIIGHEAVVQYFRRLLAAKRLGTAYALIGPHRVGKRTVAREVAFAFLCQQPANGTACGSCDRCRQLSRGAHPDYFELSLAEGERSIGIEAVRTLKTSLALSPSFHGRAVVLANADALTIEASNALLKLLEEPPAATVFFLCAAAAEDLPLTVRSRVETLLLHPVNASVIADGLRSRGATQTQAATLAALACGSPGIPLRMLETPSLLADYEQRVAGALQLLAAAPAARLREVASLVPKKGSDADEAIGRLSLLATIARDVLLHHLQLPNLTVHRFAEDELRAAAMQRTRTSLFASLETLRRAPVQLRQHLHPSLIFDTCALAL